MDAVFWIVLLLLAVEIVLGSIVRRSVLFPDGSQTFYGKQQKLSTVQTKKSIPNLTQPNRKLKFRIDSTDIPCANVTTTFCEQVTNQAYPTKDLGSVLANIDAKTYENYFNKPNETIGLRIHSDEPCPSIERFIHPQLAMNVQDDWRFIINQESYQQTIHVEICEKKNSECSFDKPLPNNFVTACVQRNTKVPLLSLGEDGEILTYTYEFPSFCQCKIDTQKPEK